MRDLSDYLRAGDLLVLNTTRVLPARLIGVRADTGAKVQGLYVGPGSASGGELSERAEQASDSALAQQAKPLIWNVLLKMRRFRPGAVVTLIGPDGQASDVKLRLLSRATGEDGTETGGWNVQVEGVEPGSTESTTPEILSRVGHTPLPPYILSARKHQAEKRESEIGNDGGGAEHIPDSADRERYQTVYADPAQGRSVAAPTAGLHFTPELLSRLQSLGVQTASVVLHVGLGTFKPVETEFVEQHPMHSEWCMLPGETSRAIIETRKRGGRVIAVGTTAARTLESFDELQTSADVSVTSDYAPLSERGGTQVPSQAEQSHHTRLLIAPGYAFKHLDGLLTNFHLPRSTLIALVAALLGDEKIGVPRLMEMYRSAIEHEYRFYSFGDAMLILP